jgi:hypothetical protein
MKNNSSFISILMLGIFKVTAQNVGFGTATHDYKLAVKGRVLTINNVVNDVMAGTGILPPTINLIGRLNFII